MAARDASFDLAAALAKPGFTPAQKDAPALVDLMVRGDDNVAQRAGVALAGLGDIGRRAIEAAASQLRDDEAAERAALGPDAPAPERDNSGPIPTALDASFDDRSTQRIKMTGRFPIRGEKAARALLDDKAETQRIPMLGRIAVRARLVTALGLLAKRGDFVARATLLDLLADPEVRVRRAAIVALGKLGGEDSRAALVSRWDAIDVAPDERRSLAEALGKLGGPEVLSRLQTFDASSDRELARRRDRAVLMADRDARRDEPSDVATDVAPPASVSPVTMRLSTKAGLAPLLADELRALGFTAKAVRPTQREDETTDSTIETALSGPLGSLYASRLWMTAGFRVPLPAGDLAAAITEAMTSMRVRDLLAAWTRGPIRWRLGFADGHKRSVVWRVARDVTAGAPELINDPTATTWDVLVGDGALDIVPRRAVDPRFTYRTADVPAASHPTVAAALAYVAAPRVGERVWDPFVGSGSELVECARRANAALDLVGSDLDDAALEASRTNLAAAGLTASIERGDATSFAPGTCQLVITNPPLGGRIRGDAPGLLELTLPNVVRVLAPGGRLVWITPATRRTSPVAESLGLRRSVQLAVDLGGVRGHLERWDRR